jgi:hypothetical protein
MLYPAYVRSPNQKINDSAAQLKYARKVFKALVDIAFVNRSFFEERTSSQFIDNKLAALKS